MSIIGIKPSEFLTDGQTFAAIFERSSSIPFLLQNIPQTIQTGRQLELPFRIGRTCRDHALAEFHGMTVRGRRFIQATDQLQQVCIVIGLGDQFRLKLRVGSEVSEPLIDFQGFSRMLHCPRNIT